MTTTVAEQQLEVQQFEFMKEIQIGAPIEITFESVLAELGPGSELPDGAPFPMKIEPWPGGRWYRDLGEGAGHLWGHVQVVKPPTLLEICGPMFVSYPAMNHVQYRLAAEGEGTRLKITHRAMGYMPKDYMLGAEQGWTHGIERIRLIAGRLLEERRQGGRR